MSPNDICSHISNEAIPIIFVTDQEVNLVPNYNTVNIFSFKKSVINKFIYKAFRQNKFNFEFDNEISTRLSDLSSLSFKKGTPKITSIYKNNRALEIGKKSLSNIIGRIEEQSSIAQKLLSIQNSNKLLNIKASGGTGKTTIIKKVAYELYNRGYYKEGVNFRSCENIKSFSDFEELLIDGFNLRNILNFKDYLVENYSIQKIDLLIILDNFETVVNSLNKEDLSQVIDLLKFASDFANLLITSRERVTVTDDFEDVYSLTPLITDDAFALFTKYYGPVTNQAEIKILRQDILEDLLNNNPLAIKLVTNSRTRSESIDQLRKQIKEHFFESVNEDYTLVFKNNADLNIERTKSIYQSINYSYTTLSAKEKIGFELLSLFPDGISLSNFKSCFERSSSSHNISDKELRVLRDKSLLEDYNGTLQLQPIIRRFAAHQFTKRPIESIGKYCLDAYIFNSFILDLIEFIQRKHSTSEALKLYSRFKNNLLNVFSYIPDIHLSKEGPVPEKKNFLNYINNLQDYIINEKQINEFYQRLAAIRDYFSDIPHAETLIKVLELEKKYYSEEFELSYKELSKLLLAEEMEKRVFKNEDFIEKKYKDMISHIHSMEGHTTKRIELLINNNNDTTYYLDAHFFYLGIIDNISRKKDGFYYFEYELMFNRLDTSKLEKYIRSLFQDEHLEIMQSTYTLAKAKKIDKKAIQRLVVTNPYTKGLKELMLAFIADTDEDKELHFKNAIKFLFHIKYYYLEALYYYSLFLKNTQIEKAKTLSSKGLILSEKYRYQYLTYLFKKIEDPTKLDYNFSYSYYNIEGLESFVRRHNKEWERIFKNREIEY